MIMNSAMHTFTSGEYLVYPNLFSEQVSIDSTRHLKQRTELNYTL